MDSYSKLVPVKPSVKTGEFWMYILAGLAMLYMDDKGLTVEELTQKGAVFVTSIQDSVDKYKYILIPVFFGVKRTWLKYKEMEAQFSIELAKVRNAGKSDSSPQLDGQ